MISRTWLQIQSTVSGFIEHEDLTRGAAIAFYTTFSIGPLLIIVITIRGWCLVMTPPRGRLSASSVDL